MRTKYRDIAMKRTPTGKTAIHREEKSKVGRNSEDKFMCRAQKELIRSLHIPLLSSGRDLPGSSTQEYVPFLGQHVTELLPWSVTHLLCQGENRTQ